jgi:protocatechuate 3,4-dioxygenase beta subunit
MLTDVTVIVTESCRETLHGRIKTRHRLAPHARHGSWHLGIDYAGPVDAGQRARYAGQTEGPFYPTPELLRDTDADLVRVISGAAQALGVVTHVTGRLLDAQGRPLPGHLVEIWQCDAHGHYLAEHGTSWSNWFRKREAPDPRFQGYGRTMTGADGGYRFRTIRPVPYPGRTPHIHFKVGCCGRELLTTQMYVAGELGNERDGLYAALAPDERERVTVALRPAPEIEDGALTGTFEIVLAA